MSSHIVPLKTYFAIISALMFLTVVTVAVSMVDLGALNTTVAIGIALLKAFLVVAFFMHLKYSARILWLFAGAGLVWLVIMLTMVMTDYGSRGWQQYPAAWRDKPAHHTTAAHSAEAGPSSQSHHE